jgi:hypothetical protein
MPNQPSITAYNALQPSVVRKIREAFDDAMATVEASRGPHAPPPSEDTRAKLAKTIVDMARNGVCDVKRLRDEALSALHLAP